MPEIRAHVGIARTHFNELFVHVPPGTQVGDSLFLSAAKWSPNKNPLTPPAGWTLVRELYGRSWTDSAITNDWLVHKVWTRVATQADVSTDPGLVGARIDVLSVQDSNAQHSYGLMVLATDGSLHTHLGRAAFYEDEDPGTGWGLTTTETTRQFMFVMVRNLNSSAAPVLTIPAGQPLQMLNAAAYGRFAITGVESADTTAGPHLAASTRDAFGDAYWTWHQVFDSQYGEGNLRPPGTVAPWVDSSHTSGRSTVILLSVTAATATPQDPAGPAGRPISWTPPVHTGGSPIEAYRAFVVLPNGTRSWWEFPPEATSGNVIGDEGYVFVVARNAQGDSFPSNILPPLSQTPLADTVTEIVRETV